MKIIGCDFHPGYQQIAMLDLVTGEMVEKALSHERKEEVQAFYAGLEGSVRVGIEASGQSQWFERMLAELGHEVWIGDAAKIRASCERKQKTDRRDAELLLRLLTEDRRGKQIASYLGLIPGEYSSGGRQQRLGHISKQGSPFLRGPLVEAAQSAVRHEPEMRRAYQRLAQRKCRALAKVAMARKLAVRLYWMLRLQVNYAQLIQGSHAGQPGTFWGGG